MKDNTAWLESLQVGDNAAVHSRHTGYSIKEVVRVTATQITVGTTRYQKKNGEEIGGNEWYPGHIEPVTEEIRAEVKRSRLLATVRGVKWETMTTAQLERVAEIVKQAESERLRDESRKRQDRAEAEGLR